MAPQYWMITNRERKNGKLGRDRDALSYWVSAGGPLDKLASWKSVSHAAFQKLLIGAADRFPYIDDPAAHENQKHVTLFVHGYNNSWEDAARMYQKICASLFDGEAGLGLCILFTWPSDGLYLGYYPDRKDARESAPDLADVLNAFYDWLLEKESEVVADPKKACRAKCSVIAHSMGNYLLQKAMQYTWSRKNQPLLVALINQLLMVAADVDNDLFKGGEATDKSDGDAIANLTYRVTALYSGRDSVLGVSAGLKHFGKRRLGRTGLDRSEPVPDNVWDVDCSNLIPANAKNVHSAYFDAAEVLKLMRQLLRGVDRKVLFPGS
jgi:esterase/lipase superfamily enzyme